MTFLLILLGVLLVLLGVLLWILMGLKGRFKDAS